MSPLAGTFCNLPEAKLFGEHNYFRIAVSAACGAAALLFPAWKL